MTTVGDSQMHTGSTSAGHNLVTLWLSVFVGSILVGNNNLLLAVVGPVL